MRDTRLGLRWLWCISLVACGGSSVAELDAAALDAPAFDGSSLVDGGRCPSPVAADPHLARRQACEFQSGATTSDSLGPIDRARLPIQHVIVMMKENRSFDQILGGLAAMQPDADVADVSFTNLDLSGVAVAPFHLDTTCLPWDPPHQWGAMHADVNDGAMDGFVAQSATSTGTDGHFVMGYYDQHDLPFYHFLASTFAISDRYFASVRSGTFPNRDYLMLGTSDSVQSTQHMVWPSPSLPTIFDALDAASVTWTVYADDEPFEGSLSDPANNWATLHPWSPTDQLITDLEAGTIASVVFIDGRENMEDEHPTADVQGGEAWTKRIYDAALASPVWGSTAILFTYDEAGGFADHVPPPNETCVARPEDAAFHELGVRVPMIVVSPWARRHYVSHLEKQHTSVTRFIETVFDLPALTARDANSDALLDMFDFDCAPAPIPEAPATGLHGCGASIWLDASVFASGEPITVHFSGGPGTARDWIGVYPRAATPRPSSTIWGYCAGGGHTASATAVRSGSVTLGPGSENTAGGWPLAGGTHWTAFFLVNDGYTSIASADFDVN